MAHNNNTVRNKLIEITSQGLLLKAIAVNVGISDSDLSRYKNGRDCLKDSDVEKLWSYLEEVVIPQWQTVPQNKKPATKLEMLKRRQAQIASRNEEPEKKKSYRDLLF